MNRIINAIKGRLPAHFADRMEERIRGLRDFERLEPLDSSALTITCDDSALRDQDIVSVLNAQNLKGLISVSPDLVGTDGYLDYSALRDIQACGHELAFHGNDHAPFTDIHPLSKLTDSVADGLSRLRDHGLSAEIVVYPCGNNNRRIRQAVAPFFRAGVSTWFGVNSGQLINRYAIRRVPFGAYASQHAPSERWYQNMIDAALHEPRWIILMLHPGSIEHTTEHTVMLQRLMQYALERGLPVRSVSAHLDALQTASARGNDQFQAGVS
ncbi:polysaccharide deacetylase family protein [Methylibium petroleiphilum]|uniref:polysaccharide deacetylase family protein n=1 Tax=Methylibium petroleiphilum TaxID=105560 RepID=UPI001AC4EF82|nr:polysaccharide deacetylase family protein [Methylibium petroleiphilum]MBN9203451.1 polysaccharide deacetylase family protein [Methylibium petroleiphilum]